MLIIGIDPGISGAICFFEDGKIIDVIEMPTMAEGKKNKRRGYKESDWKTYWGSSDHLNADVLELGEDKFRREILYYCPSRGVASYLEAREQFERRVLETDDYYNGIINVRVGGSKILKEALKTL